MLLSLSKISQTCLRRSSASKVSTRGFATAVPNLTEPYGTINTPKDLPLTPAVSQSTTLPNGVKVVSVDSKQPVSTLGLFINAGSRNELPSHLGASFFLKNLAFKSTYEDNQLRFVRMLELLGATYTVTTGREHTLIASEVPTDQFGELLPIVMKVTRPPLRAWEIGDECESVEQAVNEIESNPRVLALELLHQEAYRNVGLGNSLYTPRYNIHNLNSQSLAEYANNCFTPSNLTVVATGGIDHHTLVDLVKSTQPGVAKPGTTPRTASKYAGGELRIAGDFDTHVAIGFEGAKANSKEAVALNVAQQILGSGVSYFTYSIGHGLTSRLNKNVVAANQPWVSEANAFYFPYSDSGLFGVFGVAARGNVAKFVDTLSRELSGLATKQLSAEELARGKALAKASLLAQTGSRGGLTEFVASQTAASGQTNPVDHFQAIDTVTAADVQSAVKKALKSRPTVVVLGDVQETPTLEHVQSHFK